MINKYFPNITVTGYDVYYPSGTPASEQISANKRAVKEVYSAGLRTTVLPAAKAGAIFKPTSAMGSSKVLFGHIPLLAPYVEFCSYIFVQVRRDNKNAVVLMVYQYHETLLLACHYRLTKNRKKTRIFL